MPRKTNRPRKPVSRFDKLATKLAQRPGIYSPRGLAATIGRRKYGAAGMAALAARGRSGNPGAHQRMLELEYKVRHGGLDLTPRESHELRLLYDALGVPPLHRIDLTTGRDKKALEWEVRRHRGVNPDRVENPPAGQGFATAILKGGDSKTGASSTTYATNLSCPSSANSSHPCPFLGSGCYAEYGRTNFVRARLNKDANAKSPTPEEIAEDEALEITKKIVEPVLKKGTKFPPLRLHVVGDCVSDEAARILVKAVEPILDKKVPVWTYNHAWHDISRSAWGGISVLASCETVELAKEAMGRGYAAAMVVEKFPSPKRFDLDGVKIQPCPNESVSKDIKCAGGEGVKTKACKLCFDDKRLLREKTIIAFDAHSGGKKKIVQALENIDGTKPGSSQVGPEEGSE